MLIAEAGGQVTPEYKDSCTLAWRTDSWPELYKDPERRNLSQLAPQLPHHNPRLGLRSLDLAGLWQLPPLHIIQPAPQLVAQLPAPAPSRPAQLELLEPHTQALVARFRPHLPHIIAPVE